MASTPLWERHFICNVCKEFLYFSFFLLYLFLPFFLHFLLAHGRTCHNLTPQKLVNRDFDGDCNEKLKHKKKKNVDLTSFSLVGCPTVA